MQCTQTLPTYYNCSKSKAYLVVTMSKYMLVVLNFLNLLLGMAVLAVGIYGTAVGSQLTHLVSITAPILVLVLGGLLVLASVLGLYATFMENTKMLRTYFGMLSALLLVQVIVSAVAVARRQDVDLKIYDAWGRAYDHDQHLIQKLEKTYACCGFATLHDRPIPENCATDKEFGFTRPCREPLGHAARSSLKTLGWSGLWLGLLQGLVLLLTLAMYSDLLTGERDASRLAEARHLLREGRLEAQQGKG